MSRPKSRTFGPWSAPSGRPSPSVRAAGVPTVRSSSPCPERARESFRASDFSTPPSRIRRPPRWWRALVVYRRPAHRRQGASRPIPLNLAHETHARESPRSLELEDGSFLERLLATSAVPWTHELNLPRLRLLHHQRLAVESRLRYDGYRLE